jgi:uncharacterized protein
MKDNVRLKLTDDLLILERGSVELLLANSVVRRPLYIKQGREYVKGFLKAAGELGGYDDVMRAYPHEQRLLDVMVEHGILVADSGARRARPCEMPSGPAASGNKPNVSLYLLLSQSCNMRCIYCLDGQKTYQTDKNLRMSREVAFRSVERFLDEVRDGGRLEVIFFGGEPLLNWTLAKEVISHCESRLKNDPRGRTRQYHFTTNLSIVPADLIEWARKYDISFLCDLDGPPEIHNACRPFKDGGGSYDSVARNIRLLSAAGLKVDLRATVTALNQDHLPETTQHHKAAGGNSSAFVPVMPVNSDESILPERLLPSLDRVIPGMTKVLRSRLWKLEEVFPFNQYVSRFRPGARTVVGCGAAYGNVPVVAANGDVYPCIYLVGLPRFHMGNIMDSSYPKKDPLEGMYDALHVDHREDCKQCAWRYICGGGCPVGELTVKGHPLATAETKAYCKRICCDYTQRILELLLWEKADGTAAMCAEESARVSTCVPVP